MTENSKMKLNPDALKTGRKTVYLKVKDGHNHYRLLPPFGEKSNGYPYQKWVVLWGLTDPEKLRVFPIASPSMFSEDRKCPVTEYGKLLKDKLEAMTAELKASGASEKAIKTQMNDINEFARSISPKVIFAYNAVDKSGLAGVLELKGTAHKDLKARMSEYIQDYNQDPTSVNSDPDDSGVWFDITRSGTFFETEYKAYRLQIKVKGPTGISYSDDRSPLPEALVTGWEKQAYDLTALYRRKSYEEVREVLMWNLNQNRAKFPEIVLPGFDDFSAFDEVGGEEANEVAETPVVHPKALGKTAVNLKLGPSDDDEDDAPVVQTKSSTVSKPVMKASSVEDEDVFAMADRILDN